MGDSKGALRISWKACRVVSARSTLLSVLIMLAGYLVRPKSHLGGSFTCWSRCIVKFLPNEGAI